MCLILSSRLGILADEAWMKRAGRSNSDGFGCAFIKDNRIETRYAWQEKDILAAMKDAEGYPYIAHWRYGTSGKRNEKNLHPFRIQSPTHPESVAYMAHNGILSIAQPHRKLSDTAHLALWMEQHGFHDSWLVDEEWQKVMTEFCGPGNKLVFLSIAHGITFVNEDRGKWHKVGSTEKAVWASNENCSFEYEYGDDLYSHWRGHGGYGGCGFTWTPKPKDEENRVSGFEICHWCRNWKHTEKLTRAVKHSSVTDDEAVYVCTQHCLETARKSWPGRYTTTPAAVKAIESVTGPAKKKKASDEADWQQCELCSTWYAEEQLDVYDDVLLCQSCAQYMQVETPKALDGLREI